MQELVLITKYFGQVQPIAAQAMKSLPHVANHLSKSVAAYKRQPATRAVSDSQLIDELFKSQNKGEK